MPRKVPWICEGTGVFNVRTIANCLKYIEFRTGRKDVCIHQLKSGRLLVIFGSQGNAKWAKINAYGVPWITEDDFENLFVELDIPFRNRG